MKASDPLSFPHPITPVEDLLEELTAFEQNSTDSSEPNWLKIVVFPGMLGGLTKTTLDLSTPQSMQVVMNVAQQNLSGPPMLPNLFWMVSANVFLGAISALIGTFVLSDLLDFQKSIRKIFGLSLVFGLSFSLVFDAASSKLSLEKEIGQLEGEKTQLEEMVLQSFVPTQTPKDLQLTMQNIRMIGEHSEDVWIQEQAIQTMLLIASQTKAPNIKVAGLKCLSRLAQAISDPSIQTDAVLAMERIAMESKQASLKQRSLEEFNVLKASLSPEAMQALNQAIAHLQS